MPSDRCPHESNQRESAMRAEPKFRPDDVLGMARRHEAFPTVSPDTQNRPGANDENRRLNAAIVQAVRSIKPNDGAPPGGPRFVVAWRLYPNGLNGHASD